LRRIEYLSYTILDFVTVN